MLESIACLISLVIKHVYMISVQLKFNVVLFGNEKEQFLYIGALSLRNFMLMKGLILGKKMHIMFQLFNKGQFSKDCTKKLSCKEYDRKHSNVFHF